MKKITLQEFYKKYGLNEKDGTYAGGKKRNGEAIELMDLYDLDELGSNGELRWYVDGFNLIRTHLHDVSDMLFKALHKLGYEVETVQRDSNEYGLTHCIKVKSDEDEEIFNIADSNLKALDILKYFECVEGSNEEKIKRLEGLF